MMSLSDPGSELHQATEVEQEGAHGHLCTQKLYNQKTTFPPAVCHLTSPVHLSYLPSTLLLLYSPSLFHSLLLFSSTSLTTFGVPPLCPSLNLCLPLCPHSQQMCSGERVQRGFREPRTVNTCILNAPNKILMRQQHFHWSFIRLMSDH